MPELPEVETIRQLLEPQLINQQILAVNILHHQVIAYPAAAAFSDALCMRRFTAVTRRGKFLTLHLDDGSRVSLHLRMTGCLLATPVEHPLEKHTHLIITLGNHTELRFTDPRRFGRFWLIPENEPDTISGIERLGIEPFDSALTADTLKQMLEHRRKTVKQCLLDQALIAGIGNIYSDEILFQARIHPGKPAAELTDAEIRRLAGEIPRTLRFYIEKNETTAEEFLAGRGKDYRNTPFLKVYGHSGKPCPVCGLPLTRSVIGGRSSVYCAHCQKR